MISAISYKQIWNGLQNQKQVETHYNTTLVSDPPFSCLPSSVVIIIMSVSACKHKLVPSPRITGYLYMSLCRATALCMHNRGLCVVHVTNRLGEQHLHVQSRNIGVQLELDD